MEREARWLNGIGILLAGTAVVLITLIAVGTFDPKPVGELQWERPLPTHTIAAHSQQIIWLALPTPASNYSLRLTTSHESGETDVLYGLVVGDAENYLATAVSPLGYAAFSLQSSVSSLQPSAFSLSYAPWPHVRPDVNEIWLDGVDGRVTISINRELYWSGEAASGGQVGLWVESFGETAVIAFPSLQFYAVDP